MRSDVVASWRRIRGPLGRLLRDVAPVAPFAALLALALGITVWVGAELANSYPSEAAPNGWNGAASFDAGVATLRSALVLAATIPALLWGLASTRRFHNLLTGPLRAGGLLALDLALIAVASWCAAIIGSAGASKTSNEAFWAFTVTHMFLAASFYAIAVLSSVMLRSAPGLLAGTVWVGYAVIYDNFLRWKTLRAIGLAGLQSGALPGWFFAAQAASPISVYRALLIVWHKGFRDYEERAVLEGVTLPPWMTVEILSWTIGVLWVLLPLEVAWIVWTLRHNHDRKQAGLKLLKTQDPNVTTPRSSRRPMMGRFIEGQRRAGASAWANVVSLVNGRQKTASKPPEEMKSDATSPRPPAPPL